MGCGSLSTTAFPTNHGNFGEVKGHNFPRNKDISGTTTHDVKRSEQSIKCSQEYSPLEHTQLKSESKSGVVSSTSLNSNGNHEKSSGQISRFTMSMKEIDEEKHINDDGGIWLGTDPSEDEETRNKIDSATAHVSLNEHLSSSNLVKHDDAVVSDVEIKGISANYTTDIVAQQSYKPATKIAQNVISTDNTIKPLPATASFLRHSKNHKHLQTQRLHYDSVEEAFSSSYGHFDDDKQMSDSELDDYASGIDPSETELLFSGNNNDGDCHGDDVQLTGLDTDADGRNIVPSRLTGDQNDVGGNTDSDYSLPGVMSKEHGAQSPLKTRDTMLQTFHGDMSLESLPVCPDNPLIPHFMVKCVTYIEAEGLKAEGLYRISGNKSLGEQFLHKYSTDPEVDMTTSEVPVHVIANLLKSFVNNLNEALIPSNLYDKLVHAMDVTDRSSQPVKQRDVIKKLPKQQFAVLKYIIEHLHKVSQYQEFNSMNSSNLAKCWWPTLVRLQFSSYEHLIRGSQVPEQVVQTLIEQCQFLFHGGNEV